MTLMIMTGARAIMVNSSTLIYSFNVTSPEANVSNLSCPAAYVHFSVNISNYQYIDHVTFTIQGNEYEADSAGKHFWYDYYKSQLLNDFNGTLDWTRIKIWDIGGGIAQAFPDLHIPISCVGCHYNITTGSCAVNDSRLVQYIGNGVPGCDNYNESQSCNYCTEDIIETVITPCNGTVKNVSYTDNNYSTCCGITALSTDCHINFTPYNSTQELNCSFEASDFALQCDPAPIIESRIPCLINLNDNKTYKCWSMISQSNGTGSAGNYLQVNPVKTEFSSTVIPTQTESREYFEIVSGVGSIYYTSKSLVADTEYLLGVKCADADGNIKLAEQKIRPVYASMDAVAARGVWAKTNFGAILIILLSILVVGGVIVALYTSLKGEG